MSQIRQDPTTKEWVIVAPVRGLRPLDLRAARPSSVSRRDAPERVATCPFCPGNEGRTPGERLRLPEDPDSPWQVRVVPNKFAALEPDGAVERHAPSPLFREMSGVGHHEVIIETPVHSRPMVRMSDAEVGTVLRACHARQRALKKDTRIRYVIIFKNHGLNAGTSLEHPHLQLIGTPVAPQHVRQKYEVAIAHWDDTGRCLYCDIFDSEVAARARVVLEHQNFVVVQPFAAGSAFETWILPRRHQASFGQVSPADLDQLAHVLRVTLNGLYDALGDPDYNLMIHSAPIEDEHKPYFLWHVQIIPRLATLAGFELGSGMRITTVSPEESARVLRDVITA